MTVEATESAMKLARQYKVARSENERYKVISRSPSYHGSTLGALSVTGYAPLTSAFEPMMQGMPKIPAPRAYLDGLDINSLATGLHYAQMLEDKIIEEGPHTVLAFIVEPIGGASTGALVPPAGYMKAIRDICDRHGVLLIHDEVMSGGGRTGKFLGADHWDVKPDLICLSKGFGGGYVPLGAVIASDEIVETVLDAGGFAHRVPQRIPAALGRRLLGALALGLRGGLFVCAFFRDTRPIFSTLDLRVTVNQLDHCARC